MTDVSVPTRSAARKDRPRGRERKAESRHPGSKKTMAAMLAPSIFLLIALNAYPLFYAVSQSLRDGGIAGPGEFIGLENYTTALQDPAFWEAVRFTLLFTVVSVFVAWVIGTALALVLRRSFPGRSVFRVLLLLPWVVPVVVSTTSWNFLVATPSSPVPTLLRELGFGDVQILANPGSAMAIVIIFKIWGTVPFMMMMMSSALQAVDPSVEEACRLDGASRWQRIRHVILPIMSKPVYIAWVLASIFTINDFPSVFLLTGGGPVGSTSTLVVFAYRLVFQDFRTGYGVAVAFLITTALIAMSIYFFRRINRASANG
ncbi:Trehalose transport system permease protein SugA [Streptomyces sp. S4.7]|uniref:carbohydrate ABC transporter permease n=1 Tax=Streptomyces sp. S4.7 TaxID=2705439 RepID=UPI0013974492|nr:sugar ABC transporter permease [Streptomyces sp. S4.7]QHY94213.1 Trehalose transport system permease protein SugA [Streptomyces sp. S4.7]